MSLSHDDVIKMSIEDIYSEKKRLQGVINRATQEIRSLRKRRSQAEFEEGVLSREMLRRAQKQTFGGGL